MAQPKRGGNLLLAVIAVCTIAASIIFNATLIPPAQPVAVSYPASASSSQPSNFDSISVSSSPSSTSSPSDPSSGISDTPSAAQLVDINRADAAQLDTLPGIGPALSQRIIEYRQQNGRFETVEELVNVKGIGEKTLEKLKPYITCGDGSL